MLAPFTTIDKLNQLVGQMDTERQSFISHYAELQQFIAPRRGRFFQQDVNKGGKRHQAIINSVGTQALRAATSGMLQGTMSPSRPWFMIESFNPDLMESQRVREWFYKTEIIIRTILNESNFYNMAPVFLKELLLFSTAVMSHVDDFNDVARFYTHTAGSYYLGQNERLVIDTLVRKFDWPVIQIVKKFGIGNVSTIVKNAYDHGNYTSLYPITHFIAPNEDFQASSPFSINRKFVSIYYEHNNTGADKDKFLSTGGFKRFPAYVTRWDITEGDVYGVDCPGMTSLGDVKGLQIEEKMKAQAIQMMVKPPLSGPPAVKNVAVSGLPGSLTVYDGGLEKQKLEPIYQVDPRLQELRGDMDAIERRINSAFFVDLFFAITQTEGIQPRNELDLTQRVKESLTQLGPVLERLHGEFLSLLIGTLFDQAADAGILPPAPEELQGSSIRIRFISTLAMAQRAIVTQDIERLAIFTASLIEGGWQEVGDKFDADQAVDQYSRAIGVPPDIVVSDEDVDDIRRQRAEQLAEQQAIEAASSIAQTVKTASEIGSNGQST